MKKFFASILAVAMAAVMVCGSAFADKVITTSVEDGKVADGNFMYDLGAWCAANDVDVTTVGGVRVTIKVATLDSGFGGGIIFNTCAPDHGWDQGEWGNADAGKAISAEPVDGADMTFTVTRMADAGTFSNEEGENGLYNNFALSSWWGSDFEVTKVEVLDANGDVMGAKAPAETPAETPTDSAAQTGDAMNLVVLFGAAAVAFVAVVASKKARA